MTKTHEPVVARRRQRWAGALIPLAAGLLIAAAPAEQAEVVSVRGDVQIGSGEPPVWRAARAGERLVPGDSIRTGRNGRAQVRLRSGDVRLYENSLLLLPRAPEADGERVRMEHGQSLFDVLLRSVEEHFEVETPEVAVMVKGTRFAVQIDDAAASVAVYRGSVGVRRASEALEAQVPLRAGFSLSTVADAPFELTVNTGGDPWDAWAQDLPPPPLPEPEQLPDHGQRLLERARESALRSVHGEVERLEVEDPVPEPVLAPEREKLGAPGALDPSVEELEDPVELDPLLDYGDQTLEESLREEFTEAFVDGTTGLVGGASTGLEIEAFTDPKPSYVQITGPSINQSLDEQQLDTILSTGNTGIYDPNLLSYLNSQGADPIRFAAMLRDMM